MTSFRENASYLTLMIGMILGAASPTYAVDGALEINQACALNTGCFTGDAAGFPVTISTSGSYVLTSNLTVPADTNGISATVSNVGIDLNKFLIAGPVTCTTGPNHTVICDPGTSRGIHASSWSSVRDGHVRGFGIAGIQMESNARVRDVTVSMNARYGLLTNTRAVVNNVSATFNGENGIEVSVGSVVERSIAGVNGLNGIDAPGSTVVGNSAYFNGLNGIDCGIGSVVRDNTTYENGQDGILGNQCTVSGNTAYNNVGNGIDCRGCTVQGNVASGNDTGFGLVGYTLAIVSAYGGNVFQGNNGGNANPQVSGGTETDSNVCGTDQTCP